MLEVLAKIFGSERSEKTQAAELVYHDGTGTTLVFGPLAPGRYQLGFGYGVSRNLRDRLEKTLGDARVWQGTALTEVPIEVLGR